MKACVPHVRADSLVTFLVYGRYPVEPAGFLVDIQHATPAGPKTKRSRRPQALGLALDIPLVPLRRSTAPL